jgi:hypothetical protein
MPDDFTCEGESAGTQWVNYFIAKVLNTWADHRVFSGFSLGSVFAEKIEFS